MKSQAVLDSNPAFCPGNRLSSVLLLLVTATLIIAVSATASSGQSSEPAMKGRGTPAVFIKNMGQWDSQILYMGRFDGGQLWITNGAFYLRTQRIEESGDFPPLPFPVACEDCDDWNESGPARAEASVVKISVSGVDSFNEVFPSDRQDYSCNFYIGRDSARWRRNVPTYKTVGISMEDIEITLNADMHERTINFNVKPQTTVASGLSLNLESVSAVSTIEREGDKLSIKRDYESSEVFRIEASDNGLSSFSSTQDNRSAVLSFDITENNRTAGEDRTGPTLSFSTYFGGTGDDYFYGVGANHSAEVFLVGRTSSADIFLTDDANDSTLGGGTDAIITKLAADNSPVYSTFLGGSNDDWAHNVNIDSFGDVYVVGRTESDNLPILNAAQSFRGGGEDVFYAKLSGADYSLVYCSYLGGSGDEIPVSLCIGPTGKLYIIGDTKSPNFPVTLNAYQSYHAGGTFYVDAYISIMSVDGSSLEYSTYYGGSEDDFGNCIYLEENGAILFAGQTSSMNLPLVNPISAYNKADCAVMVGRFDSTGTILQNCTKIGGDPCSAAFGIDLDSEGRIWLCGAAYSGFPFLGGIQSACNNGWCGFVTCLHSSLTSITYSTYIGGSSGDSFVWDIKYCPTEGVLVSGQTSSDEFLVTDDAYQSTSQGSVDAFFSRLNWSGCKLVYSTYLGGSGLDFGPRLTLLGDTAVLMVGNTSSLDFPLIAAYQDSLAGGQYDAFMARFEFDPSDCCIETAGDVDNDGCDEINVVDITYLVDYLFRGGPAPVCEDEADVNGLPGPVGPTDVADLTYLIDYVFRGGPEPPPCP